MQTLLDAGRTEVEIQTLIEAYLHRHGKISRRSSGMCGSIYFFDQGEHVHPRWIAVKIPRTPNNDRTERNKRFVREMKIQHDTFQHIFVCWPFDYQMILDTPAALYRAADGDLSDLIPDASLSDESRLSVLIYLCSALKHCRSRGMSSHQDLKPQNVLVRHIPELQRSLPDQKVFIFPQLADFGLANTWEEQGKSQGARPYMAPEQWLQSVALPASDIFALGVIIFETMTRGQHPIGELVRDWWPKPVHGNSRKWLRDDMWIRWAKSGTPIHAAEMVSEGVYNVVRECLRIEPEDRPELDLVQGWLIDELRTINADAAYQAHFQTFRADQDARNNEWPHRDQRFARLRDAVEQMP
jgi:eukaryotic-like serine/threonine-protein kinase